MGQPVPRQSCVPYPIIEGEGSAVRAARRDSAWRAEGTEFGARGRGAAFPGWVSRRLPLDLRTRADRAGGGGEFCSSQGAQPWHWPVRGQDSRSCPRPRGGARPPPTLLERDAPPPPLPGPQRPVPPSLALVEPPGQPGGVARGRPAPLMCAGTTVIGRSLVTCGDCGGPRCCSSRSASRGSGSGSGSRAFKGDAAAARGGGWRAGGRDGPHARHPRSLGTGGTSEPEPRNPGVDKTSRPP